MKVLNLKNIKVGNNFTGNLGSNLSGSAPTADSSRFSAGGAGVGTAPTGFDFSGVPKPREANAVTFRRHGSKGAIFNRFRHFRYGQNVWTGRNASSLANPCQAGMKTNKQKTGRIKLILCTNNGC